MNQKRINERKARNDKYFKHKNLSRKNIFDVDFVKFRITSVKRGNKF